MFSLYIFNSVINLQLLCSSNFLLSSLNSFSGSVVKNLPVNVGDTGSVPDLGRPLGEGNAIHSSILAWKSPWAEELGMLWPMGLQRVGHSLATAQPATTNSDYYLMLFIG